MAVMQNTYPPYDNFENQLCQFYGYKVNSVLAVQHRQRIDAIQMLIPKPASRKVAALDIGCGSGAYAMLLAEYGYDTFGVDVSRGAVSSVRSWGKMKGYAIHVIICDAQHLPFRPQVFDVVVCSEVLEHLESMKKGAIELKRVLGEKGRAIMSLPNRLSIYWRYTHFVRKIRSARKVRRNHIHGEPSILWSLNFLRRIGLYAISFRSTYFIPVPFAARYLRVNFIWNKIDRLLSSLTKFFGSFAIFGCIKNVRETVANTYNCHVGCNESRFSHLHIR